MAEPGRIEDGAICQQRAVVKTRLPTFLEWVCPKCGGTYTAAIACLAVACPQPYHGTNREPVAMTPIKEPT